MSRYCISHWASLPVLLLSLLVLPSKGVHAQAPSIPVPASLFGMHLHDVQASWPDAPVGALAKGSQYGWVYVEPQAPVGGVHNYNWSFIDAWVADAEAHDVPYYWSNTYVPKWAVQDASTCTYTPVGQPANNGCTGMIANIENWRAFTTALVTRYKGRIKSYELWNEPDQKTEWSGSVADMILLTNTFHDVIRSVDSEALITSPTVNGYYSTFMNTYWASGGTTDVDVIDFHGEPGSVHAETVSGALTSVVKAMMKKYGMSSKPIWDTEAMPSIALTEDQLVAFVAVDYVLHWSDGVSRLYWYEWNFAAPSSLSGNAAETAYKEVYNWMTGAEMSTCSMNGSQNIYGAIYTCGLTKAGIKTRIVWNSAGSSTYSVPTGYTKYEDLAGVEHQIGSTRKISISNKPLLLEP